MTGNQTSQMKGTIMSDTQTTTRTSLLQIYGRANDHEASVIRGTPEALKSLRDALDAAIATGATTITTHSSAGDKHMVEVQQLTWSTSEEKWRVGASSELSSVKTDA